MEIKHDAFLDGSKALKLVMQAHYELSLCSAEGHVLIRDNYSVIYAEDNGIPVGCIVFYRYLNCCFMTLTYVAETHRMQGIFKSMFAYLNDLCKGIGIIKIEWGCHVSNKNAEAVYRTMGFNPIGYHYSVKVSGKG